MTISPITCKFWLMEKNLILMTNTYIVKTFVILLQLLGEERCVDIKIFAYIRPSIKMENLQKWKTSNCRLLKPRIQGSNTQ